MIHQFLGGSAWQNRTKFCLSCSCAVCQMQQALQTALAWGAHRVPVVELGESRAGRQLQGFECATFCLWNCWCTRAEDWYHLRTFLSLSIVINESEHMSHVYSCHISLYMYMCTPTQACAEFAHLICACCISQLLGRNLLHPPEELGPCRLEVIKYSDRLYLVRDLVLL